MAGKRKAVYDPVAQKKWASKNRENRNANTRRSNAKRYIREDANLYELNELQKMIEERREFIMNNVDFANEETIIAIAKHCDWRDDAIERQMKTDGIVIYDPEEWVEEQQRFASDNWDEDELENWFENIGVKSWDDLLEQLGKGKMGVVENGVENGIYEGRPFVMVTPL